MIERMVLLGASGDLTSRLLMPAVSQLAEAGLLPPGFTILGAANTGWSTEDFRQHIAEGLEKHAAVSPSTRDAVVGMLGFRIDHFLSSELVRRVPALRFLNRIFEPVLNAAHVERVDISWLESLTLEGRASYYDGAGALKDMVQNHLMELMALVLMEQPARVDADSVRGVRVEALRSVATPSAATAPARSGPGRCRRASTSPASTPAATPRPTRP